MKNTLTSAPPEGILVPAGAVCGRAGLNALTLNTWLAGAVVAGRSGSALVPWPGQSGRALEHRAWTNAWGRLPRCWCWRMSNSSVNSPGGPQAARLRSNQPMASVVRSC